MSDFLEQVVATRREYVERAKRERPEEDLLGALSHNTWTRAHVPSGRGQFGMGGVANAFEAALRNRQREGRLAVIAEVKRISPALGEIASPTIDVAQQAMLYGIGGAAAISVLVEPMFWGGSLDDLRRVRAATEIPILAKDVIVDEYQIVEARAGGADAVLLIAEVLTDDELHRFVVRAATLSMGALVEAHEAVAFGRAVEAGTATVGVNARNLRRPEEIDIGRARQLHTFVKEHHVLVAESGISSADDARLLPSRVDAVLVGTALMRAEDPTPLIRELAAVRRTGEHKRTITRVFVR